MRTRKALIEMFLALNEDLITPACHSPDAHAIGGEWDAVNERYGRRGRSRVRTLRDALRVCARRDRRVWTLDMDTLNETGPARAVDGFRAVVTEEMLPDWVTEQTAHAESEIRSELDDMRAEIARLKSDRDWADLISALDRAASERRARMERLVA